ncbi:cytochrome P450 [Allosalinactinospora lopnorensis]|uniref:cytochrome P450 n=1 Tax=Allosalinactinospora lopnorensis TaxID=1352348 RepID=UPI000697CEE6|nr:cytochrome P450 [Allosalinactinospora lopnorensis]
MTRDTKTAQPNRTPVTPAPGPRGLPLLGNLGPWQRNTAQFLLDLQRDYGDIVRMKLGPLTVHQVSDPIAVRHILVDNNQNYGRGLLYDQFKLVMGEGLLTSDGDFWRGHRRAVQPAFLKSAMGAVAPNVVQATAEMLDTWEVKARTGKPIDLLGEMLRLTLVTLSRSLFDHDVKPSTQELKQLADGVVEVMFKRGTVSELLPSWLPTARNKKIARIDEILERVVREVRDSHTVSGGGFLTSLMKQAVDPVTGEHWTDREIRDELVTIYLAGHETTAVALFWTLVSLAEHPWAKEELNSEIDQVLGGAPPNIETVDSLDYTRMVIEESLRLYPPIWAYPRGALGDDTVGGHSIPAGSNVLLSPLVSHRNPRYWENPDTFNPLRFAPAAVRKRPRMAYFPFGGGPRLCVGQLMAMLELRMIISMISQRFELSLTPDADLAYGAPLISLRPHQDVMVRLRPRTRTAGPVIAG